MVSTDTIIFYVISLLNSGDSSLRFGMTRRKGWHAKMPGGSSLASSSRGHGTSRWAAARPWREAAGKQGFGGGF